MRKIQLIILSLFIFNVSCDLEEYNPSGSTPEAVYTIPEGFETLVNAAYSYQRWWYGKEEGFNITEMGTDIWTSAPGDVSTDLSSYINLQGANSALTAEWKAFYAAINLCNAGISCIDEAKLTPEKRKQYEAELRFLRAFYYWHIVETWGGVHFTIEETKGIVVTANKTPIERFYTQIFEDLNFAINNLANTTTNYGKVTKPAAMSFLARMYLTRGMYAEANAMARSVINGGFNYQLEPNYGDLWKMNNNKNKEILYAVNYATDLTLNDKEDKILFPIGHSRGSNNGHLLFLMAYDKLDGMERVIEYGRPFNRYMPTRKLLEMYQQEDARYDDSFMEVWFAINSFPKKNINKGDTAVIATRNIYKGNTTNKTVFDIDYIYKQDGTVKDRRYYPTLKKHMDPTRSGANEAQSARDAYVIRLAEVYLIAAEAQMNLGRNDSAAYYINFVRERAAKPGKADAMKITATDVSLDFILDERAREFAGEQLRWFDLKRTGKLLDRVKALNPDAAPNIQSHHIVRPIPQSQLDAVLNRDEFNQNIGYK